MRNRIAYALFAASDLAERFSHWLIDRAYDLQRSTYNRETDGTPRKPPVSIQDYVHGTYSGGPIDIAADMLTQPNSFAEELSRRP